MMCKAMAVFGMVLAVFGICGNARAQPANLRDVYGAYSSCLDRLARQDAFLPLRHSGFFSDVVGGGGGNFVTPAQALLVAQFQAQAAACQVDLRTALENVDSGLADLALQERQLTDVNELMLIDRMETWNGYIGNRRQIEGNFWRAAARPGVADAPAQIAQDKDGAEAALN